MAGLNISGRFLRSKIGELFPCLGIDLVATADAPSWEGFRIYECANSCEAFLMRDLLVRFGLIEPRGVGSRKFDGVFHDGQGGFVFFSPVPDHSGNHDGLVHGHSFRAGV